MYFYQDDLVRDVSSAWETRYRVVGVTPDGMIVADRGRGEPLACIHPDDLRLVRRGQEGQPPVVLSAADVQEHNTTINHVRTWHGQDLI